MTIQFERATKDDHADIWAMFTQAMKPHVEKIWGWDEGWQTNEFEKRFDALNTSYIYNDHQRVGYIQYEVKADCTYLNMLVLRPGHRGQAIGRHVLDAVQKMKSGKPLSLRCFQINTRAYQFYLKQGFRVLEREEHFFLMERESI